MGDEAIQRTHANYALDAIAIGVIVTDSEARLVYANAAADRLLNSRSGALRYGAGKISTTRVGPQGDLHEIIARTCTATGGTRAGDTKTGGNYMRARAGSAGAPDLALCVVPVHGEQAGAPMNAMVLVRPIEPDCNLEIEARRLFGLTRSEAKFASAIASGLSLLEAAASYGVTLATARSHLKSIFRKTGLSRQSQVAGLLRSAQLPIQLG